MTDSIKTCFNFRPLSLTGEHTLNDVLQAIIDGTTKLEETRQYSNKQRFTALAAFSKEEDGYAFTLKVKRN